MTRVLHVLTSEGGGASGLLAALVADLIRHEPGEHHALLLGGAALRDAADEARLSPYTLLPEPAGVASLLAPWHGPLHRLLTGHDRIDAWTPRAAELARRYGATAVQPRFHPDALARLAAEVGDTSRLKTCDRGTVRAKWGVSPQDRVIALLGDRPADGDAPGVALAMLMAQDTLDSRASNETDQATPEPAGRVRLLCHPAAAGRRPAQRTLALSGHGRLLIQDPLLAVPWHVLPACDAVLPAHDARHAPIARDWARRAGVPVLETQSSRARDTARIVVGWIDGQPAMRPVAATL